MEQSAYDHHARCQQQLGCMPDIKKYGVNHHAVQAKLIVAKAEDFGFKVLGGGERKLCTDSRVYFVVAELLEAGGDEEAVALL